MTDSSKCKMLKNKRILCLFSSKEDEDIFNLPFLGKEGAGHSKRADRGSGQVWLQRFSVHRPQRASEVPFDLQSPLGGRWRRQTGRASCRIYGRCSRDIISFHPPSSPYGRHPHPNFVDDELGPERREASFGSRSEVNGGTLI